MPLNESAPLMNLLSATQAEVDRQKQLIANLMRHRQRLEELANQRTDELQVIKNELLHAHDEYKRLDDALGSEHQKLHVLMDNVPDTTIYFKDKESRFTKINRAQATLLGITDAESAIGKTDADFFLPEHALAALADELSIVQTGQPIIGKIEKVRNGRGEFQWVSTTKMPLYDKKNDVIGTFGITRDITPLKQFENALQDAKSDLELRVSERTHDLTSANNSLKTRVEQLNFLNTSIYELAQYTHLDELLAAIIHAFNARFESAEASICLRSDQGFKCEATSRGLNTDNGRKNSEQTLSIFSNSELQRPFLIEDWNTDDHISQTPWHNIDHLPCYMVIPMLADNTTVAIVQIFTTSSIIKTYQQELPVLTMLAAHAAVCVSNVLHFQELGEKARLDGELNAARTIQRRFTPNYKPAIPRINIKGIYYPAYEVGGDYLDYFKTESGKWVIVIADVCGKGIPAALVMTMLRSTFRAEGRIDASAKKLLCAVNDSMKSNLDDRSFVTAICLVISPDGSSMSYARAGHPMLVRLPAKQGEAQNVPAEGIALGLITDTETFNAMIDELTVPLIKGERYLIYTDGLIDVTNAAKENFGQQRIMNMLAADRSSSAELLIARIMENIKSFAQDVPYHDDLTILAMEVTG